MSLLAPLPLAVLSPDERVKNFGCCRLPPGKLHAALTRNICTHTTRTREERSANNMLYINNRQKSGVPVRGKTA